MRQPELTLKTYNLDREVRQTSIKQINKYNDDKFPTIPI